MSFDPQAFNPHAPEFLANPYPTYADFRRVAPVSRVKPYNSWWVFRYDDVKTVLDDRALFLKSPLKPAGPTPIVSVLSTLPPGVFSMDPPRHDVVRPIMDQLFAAAIAPAGELGQAVAKSLLAAVAPSQRFDLVSGYAAPLPAAVLLTVLGIPVADHTTLSQFIGGALAGHDVTASAGARGYALACDLALGAYFQGLMALCPAHAELTGMVPAMATTGIAQGMHTEEAQQSAVNLSIAGYLSTTFLIASGTLNLLRTEGAWQQLREQPTLLADAIEEMLRFDAPAQLVDRYAAADTELGGVAIQAGDLVTAVLGSANHDDDVFPDPEAFDITRKPRGHVGFGDGIHYCLGAPLARVVAPLAFDALLDAYPVLSVAGHPQWQTDPYLRALANLPIAVG